MDIYDTETIEQLNEDDVINDFEEGFMLGYLSACQKPLTEDD